MTAAFWLYTFITIMLVCVAVFAWWASDRIEETLAAAKLLQKHMENGTRDAARAAIDARASLNVLRAWWVQLGNEPPPGFTPAARTDTAQVPAIRDFAPTPPGRVDDQGMAEVLAHADNDLLELREKWGRELEAPTNALSGPSTDEHPPSRVNTPREREPNNVTNEKRSP